MRNIFKIIVICFFSLVIISRCSQQKKTDLTAQDIARVRHDIEKTWKQFIDKWEQGSAVAAAAFFTEDGINVPSLDSTQRGRDEISAYFTNIFLTSNIEVVSQKVNEVFVHENMAYEFGTIEQIVKPHNAEAVNIKHRYVSVFKKQEDGSWKFHRWMGQQAQEDTKVTNSENLEFYIYL